MGGSSRAVLGEASPLCLSLRLLVLMPMPIVTLMPMLLLRHPRFASLASVFCSRPSLGKTLLGLCKLGMCRS